MLDHDEISSAIKKQNAMFSEKSVVLFEMELSQMPNHLHRS